MHDTGSILAERNHTHGSFSSNAKVSQGLKRILHAQEGWDSLSDVQCEAIDMICCKLSRIVSGHGEFADHWADCAGYATLALKELEK